jgi:HCOMODA/2-hydroxy-3-carboxy-muconic semialdehyde decarboxylase
MTSVPADDLAADLLDAAAVLDGAGLVTAFGHVSARLGADHALITPGIPMAEVLRAGQLRQLSLDDEPDMTDLPGEAWIHWAVYRARRDVGGICRAQPPGVDLASAVGVRIVPRHGQGSFLGPELPIHDDPRLIRARGNGEALTGALGEASAVAMRGNGAVAVGAGIGEAVARMWVLERSARLNVAAAGHDTAMALDADERAAWEAVQSELLGRIWRDLRQRPRKVPL